MTRVPGASEKGERTHPPPAEETTASTSMEMGEQRDKLASKLVDHFALWSGAAGLIPVPLLDVAAVGGIQIQMLRRLSQIYGVPFAENRGKALIASLAGSMIPATSGFGAASALKGVPLIGMTVAALVMPTLSAGATYAIGKAFIQHFRSGGTLLDFNPPDYRESIKAQKETWSTRSAAPRAAAQAVSARSGLSTGAGSSASG